MITPAINLFNKLISNSFTNRFRIPTLLGLGIIIVGIVAGVFLTLREQNFLSKASPDVTAQNIIISNITETSVTISYQTSSPTSSFVTFGQANPNEQTALDDRDSQTPKAYSMHYVTLKNLLPKTTYKYKIISGKILSNTDQFTTATPLTSQIGFRPVIGSILDVDKPLSEGIVYLSIADANPQAILVKSSGNFLIPLSQIRKADLSDAYSLTEDTTGKLTVISNKGSASVLFKLATSGNTLPPLKLGQNVDLTNLDFPPKVASSSAKELNNLDLNGDGKINAADNAILLQNFGKKGQAVKGDLNSDGVINQKDLDLMAKKINQN